ncbi:MAG: triose-phosphate isomerase [Vampirovibrionales bacterium]|nr:triose-phosphate isomerase [Vampirovibrionales bacterium]
MANAKRQILIAGNWKMYKTTAEAQAFVEALAQSMQSVPQNALPQVIVAAPFTALSSVAQAIKDKKLPVITAAQTMESKEEGAYTGEISPKMLLDIGVKTVVIGHSERRQYYNETDTSVNAKTLAALKHGMTPIVCVGELLSEREAKQTDAVIERQVNEALKEISSADYAKLVFAYEPVWAIGTGKVCESPEANRVCALIRTLLNQKGDGERTRVLYGGSVKPDNIDELLGQSDIDGALVGGASLEAESFFKLVEAGVAKTTA